MRKMKFNKLNHVLTVASFESGIEFEPPAVDVTAVESGFKIGRAPCIHLHFYSLFIGIARSRIVVSMVKSEVDYSISHNRVRGAGNVR